MRRWPGASSRSLESVDPDQGGFTLIELLVVMSMTSLIALAMAGAMRTMARRSRFGSDFVGTMGSTGAAFGPGSWRVGGSRYQSGCIRRSPRTRAASRNTR